MIASGRIPWLTLVLISANLGLAFWATLTGQDMLRHPLGLVGSLFLHLSLLHLLGNMVFLAAVGPYVESAVGAGRYALVYLGGGLTGALLHQALMSGTRSPLPLVGASGCIAACIGYAGVRYARSRVPFAPRLEVPAWAVTVVWVALQVAGALTGPGADGGGIAYWAHLGGLFFGVAMSLLLRAPAQADESLSARAMAVAADRSPAASLEAARRHLLKHPNDANALRQAAEAARTLGDRNEEIAFRVQLLASEPDEAVLRLADLGALARVPSLRRMKLVDQVAPGTAHTLLLSVLAERHDPERPNALLRLAEQDPAGGWTEALAQDYPIHPATDLARVKGLIR